MHNVKVNCISLLSFEAVSLFRPCSQIKRNAERYYKKQALPIVDSSSHSKDLMKFFLKTSRARAESNDIETSFQIDVISFRQIITRSSLDPQFECMVFFMYLSHLCFINDTAVSPQIEDVFLISVST